VTLELLPADGAARETLRELLREAGLPTAGVGDGPGRFFLAVAGDETVGGGGVEPYGEAALLRSVVVHPERRGVGVGTALVGRLSEVAAATGADELWLLTETAESFFSGLGFERVPRGDAPPPVRQSEEFTEVCGERAVCMTRPLGGDD
jgi:N-acetylglutamate synthase-like GNAT family acetyltransferase